jgi:hypothetical protein
MSDQPPARIERDGALATIVIEHPPLNLFGEPLVSSLALFGSEDLREAVKSFLEEGPGKATFAGR